jgi:hypothetical protein
MQNLGFQFAIVDNGFVYVGNIIRDGEYYAITSCHNVRKAGTTKGFGQLAIEGPLKETALDKCPTVLVPVNRLCHFIACNADAWKAYM